MGHVTVELIPEGPPYTRVVARFDGLQLAVGTPPIEQQLHWEERGGTWVFRPCPGGLQKVGR